MSILQFWKQTKAEVKDLTILAPSNRLSEQLRKVYIPNMLKIITQEQEFKSSNTLDHFLQFLFLY